MGNLHLEENLLIVVPNLLPRVLVLDLTSNRVNLFSAGIILINHLVSQESRKSDLIFESHDFLEPDSSNIFSRRGVYCMEPPEEDEGNVKSSNPHCSPYASLI